LCRDCGGRRRLRRWRRCWLLRYCTRSNRSVVMRCGCRSMAVDSVVWQGDGDGVWYGGGVGCRWVVGMGWPTSGGWLDAASDS
nr:hypothetical protein [Tanacetum cinerariifolium]